MEEVLDGPIGVTGVIVMLHVVKESNKEPELAPRVLLTDLQMDAQENLCKRENVTQESLVEVSMIVFKSTNKICQHNYEARAFHTRHPWLFEILLSNCVIIMT